MRILVGEQRKGLYKRNIQRFYRDVVIQFKYHFDTHVDYVEGLHIINTLRKRHGRSLNPPVKELDQDVLHVFAVNLANYFKLLRRVNSAINDTAVSVEIFTACMLVKLATGYTVNNVVIVPKIKFFVKTVPREIEFAELNVRCRAMSEFNRHIQCACVTKSNFVRCDLIFKPYKVS